MKLFYAFLFLLVTAIVFSQTPAPTLSTADKVAIQAMEEKKRQAQQMYNEANQGETAILQEWAAAHHGYRLNPITFAVESDPKPAAKPDPPKETKKP